MAYRGLLFACAGLGAALAFTVEAEPLSLPVAMPAIQLAAPAESHASCAVLTTPPAAFATESKYDQDSAGHDVIDDLASDARSRTLGDAQHGVRLMQALVMPAADGGSGAYQCARTYLLQWARAESLTVPASDDAERSLARLTADLAVVVLRLESADVLDESDRPVIDQWLQTLAQTVRQYFDDRAGPITSRNNHRYWAALALAGVGKATNRNDDLDWAASSYALGVCQVTSDGILPLELARETQARNYHLYAYEALRGVELLLPDETSRVASQCLQGLERLRTTVTRLDAGQYFEALTGALQSDAPASPDPVLLLL